MNENKQTIELEIKSQAQQAKTSVDTLLKSLTNVEHVVTNVYLELGRVEKGLKNTSNNSKDTTNNLDKMRDKADKTSNAFSRLSKALSLGALFHGTRKIASTFLDWMGLSVDRSEQLNLFNVVFKNMEENGKKTFSELGKEATKFQNKLNEAFGTNMTETTKFQGLFQSMGENVGISDYYSSIMSETMSKLTYDLASLYNKQETDVAEALRAGVYAGQTKPLRAYGVDVTQTSLQPILNELGIDDRTISQMSQAEKEILRYIATLKQAKVAMGDFANTVESPANQLKVFKQQLVEVKIAISNLFMGLFSQILPYLNAFLMVVKEVAKAIASMLGIQISDYNTGIATATELYDDMGDSIDNATGKVKELKRQTLGFDQINNINENNASGSGVGAISGGIDQRLLDAIKGYDNGMDKVRMKATEIRDKWMEILGFTKHTNEETGETYFTYDGIHKTIKNIVDKFKELPTYAKVLTGLGIGAGLLKIFSTLKKILGLTGIPKLLKDIVGLFGKLSGEGGILSSLTGGFEGLAGALGVSTGALGLIVAAVLAVIGVFTHAYTTSEKFRDKINDAVTAVKDLFVDLFKIVSGIFKELYDLTEPLWKGMQEIINTYVGILYEYVVTKFSLIADTITGLAKIISDIIHLDFKQAFEDAKTMVKNLYDDWKNWLDKLGEKVLHIGETIFNSILDFVPKVINKLSEINDWVKELPAKFLYYAGQAVGSLWRTITETDWLKLGKDILDGIINGLVNIGNALADFGQRIWNKIRESIGSINWSNLGSDIINGIANGINGIGSSIYNFGSSFISGVKSAFKADGGSYYNGSWHSIEQYANGGMPRHGSMFVAGEAGAEIVGNINGRTEVLNQSQIASTIYSAMVNALSKFNGGNGTQFVDVRVHSDASVVVDEINQITKQTGEFPLDIPTDYAY